MALRFFSWYSELNKSADDSEKQRLLELFSFMKDFKYEDFYGNNALENSLNLFKNILPERCITNIAYTFYTLPFCIRHTMKKPREVLQIFNSIIGKIRQESNTQYFLGVDNTVKIKDIVHSTQEDLITDVFSMYENFIPAIGEYANLILSGLKFVFTLDDIHKRMKEAEAHKERERGRNHLLVSFSNSNYSMRDVFLVLLETGLVGVINKVTQVEEHSRNFENSKPVQIIHARFEYQIKGSFVLSNDIQYVLHPMCYEHFGCYVDKLAMVYPIPATDETDPMNSSLI